MLSIYSLNLSLKYRCFNICSLSLTANGQGTTLLKSLSACWLLASVHTKSPYQLSTLKECLMWAMTYFSRKTELSLRRKDPHCTEYSFSIQYQMETTDSGEKRCSNSHTKVHVLTLLLNLQESQGRRHLNKKILNDK